MYHKSEDHPEVSDAVTEVGAILSNVEPELYSTFLGFQESLMRPYTSPSGKFTDEMYEKMLPVAAQLASAAATLAAAELAYSSNNRDCKAHD